MNWENFEKKSKFLKKIMIFFGMERVENIHYASKKSSEIDSDIIFFVYFYIRFLLHISIWFFQLPTLLAAYFKQGLLSGSGIGIVYRVLFWVSDTLVQSIWYRCRGLEWAQIPGIRYHINDPILNPCF